MNQPNHYRTAALGNGGDATRRPEPSPVPERLTVEVPVPGDAPARMAIPRPLLDLPLRDARSRLAEAFEVAYLNALLTRNRGRIGRTASQAGINPRTLYDKMRQFGMRKEDFKG